MEADWEVEIGGEAPVIDAHWPGFVDLRLTPVRAAQVPEAAQLPALADALVRLNALSSPVWTSKCAVWPVTEFDPDELDAPSEAATNAVACYVDLLPVSDQQWNSPESAAIYCKSLCGRLRPITLRCCRADLVIRRAHITPVLEGLGITAYLTACGPTSAEANAILAHGLAALTVTIHPIPAAS